MILWKFSLKEARRRPGRTILTLLSVVIGVASVVSVTSATRMTRRAYDEMFQTVSGQADLEIVAKGGGSFDESVVSLAEETPGVQLAVPVIRRYTILYWKDRRTKLMALGIDPKKDSAVRDYRLVAGRQLDRGTGIWLDAGLARRLDIHVNDEVKLLTRIGVKESRVVGLVEPRGGSAIAHGGLLFMSLGRAQSRFRATQSVDAVSLVLKDSADEQAVRDELTQQLPTGLSVERPMTRTQMADETLLAAEQGLRLATAFSLLLAVFVITNAFSMNVGERRRQLAIMRAVGATRRQVARVLYREALALGVVGTALGILAGWGGAVLLTRSVSQLMQTELPPFEITAEPLLLAAAFGLGIAFVGSYFPARRARKLTPLEAMRAVAAPDRSRMPLGVAFGGLAIVAIAAALLASCISGYLPIEVSVTASVLALIGLVLIAPTVLAPMSRIIQAGLFRMMKVESRLARQQLLRHRGRTTLTIGVLFVAMSTGIGLATSVVDNVHDVKDWYHKAIVGDFFVRAMMPDMATGTAADMPDGVRDEIAAIPGVTDIDSLRFVSARAEDLQVVVLVRQFNLREQVYFDLKAGIPNRVVGQLREGQVVIGTVLAQRLGLGVGDEISIETLEGTKRVTIAGTANDYIGGGLSIYMHRDTAAHLLGIAGEDVFVVKCDPRSLRAAELHLEAICDKHGLLLQSYADLVQVIDGMMAGVVGSLWGLLVLGFVVASFGVVNTLTMNVLEQTRELGMLRIVAMTRWQVRKSVFAQAAILGLMGLVPGTLAGMAVAYFMNLSTMPVTGHQITFELHPLMLAASLAVALVIVLVAAWIPAERAARLPPVEAIRYE
jgi:putative ABC transport system permease protein